MEKSLRECSVCSLDDHCSCGEDEDEAAEANDEQGAMAQSFRVGRGLIPALDPSGDAADKEVTVGREDAVGREDDTQEVDTDNEQDVDLTHGHEQEIVPPVEQETEDEGVQSDDSVRALDDEGTSQSCGIVVGLSSSFRPYQ